MSDQDNKKLLNSLKYENNPKLYMFMVFFSMFILISLGVLIFNKKLVID